MLPCCAKLVAKAPAPNIRQLLNGEREASLLSADVTIVVPEKRIATRMGEKGPMGAKD